MKVCDFCVFNDKNQKVSCDSMIAFLYLGYTIPDMISIFGKDEWENEKEP